jgi:AP-2 complex subunit alpha
MSLFPLSFSPDSTLNGYNKKKYVAKLMYMYILGYEIDFGYVEAVSLMSSTKYSEKHIVCN